MRRDRSVSSTTTSRTTTTSNTHTTIAASSPKPPPKTLVPLLDTPTSAHYVTQTAKIRWDGAMAEIGRALKEDGAPTRDRP